MNVRTKIKSVVSAVRQLEGQAMDKVKMGAKEPGDLMEASYFSGLGNGINFILYVLDNPNITTTEIDGLVKDMLHINKVVVN